MSKGLVKNMSVEYGGAAIAMASSTDDNSTRFDMAGYKHVVAFVAITDCANTGVASLATQTNSADSDTGMTQPTGAVLTATSAGDDDMNGEYLMVEVKNVLERYVQAVRVSSVANIAFGEVWLIRHNGAGVGPRKAVRSADSTVAAASVSVADA